MESAFWASRPASTRLVASRLMSHSHGPAHRFVEIVQVKNQPAIESGKCSEVFGVGVAANLYVDA